MARVTGIGGVFFKSTGDSAAPAAWYRDNLGMAQDPFGGAILRWRNDGAEDKGSPSGTSRGSTASGSARAARRS